MTTVPPKPPKPVVEAAEGNVKALLALLATLSPIDEPWPDVDEGLLPLEPGPDFSDMADDREVES